jgi:NADPH-dependent curcumin reductase CurA
LWQNLRALLLFAAAALPAMEVRNRYVATRRHIEGAPTEADFEVREETARWSPDSGEVLVRNLYLSIDPYQLNRMKRSSASHLAVDGILPGQVISKATNELPRSLLA